MVSTSPTHTISQRFARRLLIAGCGVAMVIGAVWFGWHISPWRKFLRDTDAHMTLVGVSMGLHDYWEDHGHLPQLADWKAAVVASSLQDSGRPDFDARDRLKNCFPVVGPESPWLRRGSLEECHQRGDLLLAVCDPQARFSTDESATAVLENGNRLTFFDAAGKQLGTLGPDAIIQSLDMSGAVAHQTVAELRQASER